MKIYALADTHLSFASPKPMDMFGPDWEGHWEKLSAFWRAKVSSEDAVLIAGDISWAMTLQDALADLSAIGELPGKKILIRGNHDYWWGSISRVREAAPAGMFFLQNDALKLGETVICGSRGWLNPNADGFTAEDRKIYDRELIRMEMSLAAGKKLMGENSRLIAMTHYPPVYPDKKPTAMSALFEKYNVSRVIFGHIHSMRGGWEPFELNGVKYILTAGDYIKFDPMLIYP